jgi:hypothetical protein
LFALLGTIRLNSRIISLLGLLFQGFKAAIQQFSLWPPAM